MEKLPSVRAYIISMLYLEDGNRKEEASRRCRCKNNLYYYITIHCIISSLDTTSLVHIIVYTEISIECTGNTHQGHHMYRVDFLYIVDVL